MSTGGEIKEFEALSYMDKWRVSRCLVRGEAPEDPAKAVAAVALAEKYQSQSHSYRGAILWLPLVLIVLASISTIFALIDGNELRLLMNALIILLGGLQYVMNPIVRPKNMARSLEASRRVAATTPSPR
ncbi:MAG TPA: hypothetical protein VFU16_12625 [Solirubrobacterales bacterium]|nr:hypothetical protein [Solirubrobacterales bacterium]